MFAEDLELRDFKGEDRDDLYKWRNHPVVRENSFNSNPLSWDEHVQWFERKSQSPDTTIYIAYYEEEKVGMIRFENESKTVGVSVMLNPNFIGRGLGAKLIKLGVKKFINERKVDKNIIAEIKENNIASQKAFQKAGFKVNDRICVFKP